MSWRSVMTLLMQCVNLNSNKNKKLKENFWVRPSLLNRKKGGSYLLDDLGRDDSLSGELRIFLIF